MLGTSWDAPDVMREKIRATRALTSGPIAVNLAMSLNQHERLEIALAEGVQAISFFWGDPAAYVRKAKDGGALIIQTVATPEEARRAAGQGADILVAQGVESGGHVWSTVSTMVMVPLICDAVRRSGGGGRWNRRCAGRARRTRARCRGRMGGNPLPGDTRIRGP